ncbi:MAG TPA: hypothetical protein VEL47_00745 [Myxococcota bacterium]|nr:hypothetical protein [Myxococcota bacterium]
MTALLKSMGTLLMSLLIVKSGLSTNSAKEALHESATQFDKGHYKKALLLLKSINIRSDLDSSDDMKLAFKIRAICYEETGDVPHAQETLRDLLFLDPSYQFDPFDTPTSVLELAEQERALIDKKNQQMASKKIEAQASQKLDEQKPLVELEKNSLFVERKPRFVTTLFPAGLNHFYLGSPIKGGIYLSLQTLGLGTNILAYWWKQSYLQSFGSGLLKDQNNRGRFETAQMIQYIGLGAMLIGYGASVIDAVLEWQATSSWRAPIGGVAIQ